jgi:hypothetical protein
MVRFACNAPHRLPRRTCATQVSSAIRPPHRPQARVWGGHLRSTRVRRFRAATGGMEVALALERRADGGGGAMRGVVHHDDARRLHAVLHRWLVHNGGRHLLRRGRESSPYTSASQEKCPNAQPRCPTPVGVTPAATRQASNLHGVTHHLMHGMMDGRGANARAGSWPSAAACRRRCCDCDGRSDPRRPRDWAVRRATCTAR